MNYRDSVAMILSLTSIPCWLWVLMVGFVVVLAIDTYLDHKNTPL